MFKHFNLENHHSDLPSSGRVLIAPLNWGIGHASRCISLIKQLQQKGYETIISSDGEALTLLKKVFPKTKIRKLPSYNVQYTKNQSWFLLNLFRQLPKFINTYRKERNLVKRIVEEENIEAIISDNRFGMYHPNIPSIYITHQLQVKSGIWTFFTTNFHRYIIRKYDKVWIPDVEKSPNLSGDLSHGVSINKPYSYIGILSQFEKQTKPIEFDMLVLLSGPEPQRSLLEESLLKQFQNTTKTICFVKGKIEKKVKKNQKGNIIIYNYLLKEDLELVLNQSELVIARSGYSTIMDLATLKKKAFFIPTPGQTEQIYLAKHLEKERIAPYAAQSDFKLSLLKRVENYRGFE